MKGNGPGLNRRQGVVAVLSDTVCHSGKKKCICLYLYRENGKRRWESSENSRVRLDPSSRHAV